MAAELLAGLGIFKTMLDMTKGLKDLNDAAVRNSAVVELLEKINTAQMTQASLIENISDLKKENTRLKEWDAEKENYHLKELRAGLLAYAFHSQNESAAPTHYLCANCYENKVKSILQSTTRYPGRCEVLECHRCGSDLYFTGAWQPEHAPRQGRTGT